MYLILLFYLVPAALFLLGIWLILLVLREVGIGKAGRQIWFVILSTLFLTPSVAGSIVSVAWVPNGLLLLAGATPMLHQPRLVNFAVWSFLLTAAVSAVVAWFSIGQFQRANSGTARWVRIGVPVFAIAALLTLYYVQIPDREIPDHIDWALIESEFGDVMDHIHATLEIRGLDAVRAERERLRLMLEDDPIYWNVYAADDRIERSMRTLFQREPSSSGSCSGQPGDHHRLMRCSRDVGDFFDRETLLFKRQSLSPNGRHDLLEIEFDYELFLARYPGPSVYSLDTDTLQLQDHQLLGRWQLERRSDKGDAGPRNEKVLLNVGPRTVDGTYEVIAKVDLVALGDQNQTTHCSRPQDRCKWFGTSAGVLKIRGSRVQIVYQERKWFSDRLQLSEAGLIGTDPWGDKVQFRHVD